MEIRKIPYELTWDIRHDVMWPNKPFDFVKLPNDKDGIHFGLFSHEKMVSVISLFIVDQKAQFRKFATRDEEQGKGYGTSLLTFLFTELDKFDVTKIWCNAREDKSQFYERFGMTQTPEVFDKEGINYVVMEKFV